MGFIVTFPHLDILDYPYSSPTASYSGIPGIPCESSPFAAFRTVIVHSRVLRHTLLSSLLVCAFVTPSGIPWFHNDVMHFVVVDPLKQPLVSKSDRRPVGTLQCSGERGRL
jgi:hypothetical protein